MTKLISEKNPVVVDFPTRDEIITSASYTLRLSVSREVEAVQISIDGNPWRPCRSSAGHYWYDWTGYMSGRHEVQVQSWLRDGTVFKSATQPVLVEIGARRN